MQHPRYSPQAKSRIPHRRTVAPRVTEQHSRRCALSAKTGRRCTCQPSFVASIKHGERTYSRTFCTLTEAVAWAESSRDAIRRGVTPPSALPAESLSLRDLAISFLHRARSGQALTRSRRRYTARTVEMYEQALRLRVLPHVDGRSGLPLGDLPASTIDGRTIQRLVDAVAVRASSVLARHAVSALAAVLRDGYARGLLDELPPRVILPPPPPPRSRVLTPAAANRLVGCAFDDDRRNARSLLGPLVALLASTGCRISEALGLVWGEEGLDLDAKPPVARIARATTKTAAGARLIPLDSETAALLRRHRLACGQAGDGAPVFADRKGRPLSRWGSVYDGFKRVALAAKLDAVSPHVLRHSHASWLAGAGVSPPVAAARLGHADGGALFMRVYAHPGAADGLVALAALDSYRRGQEAPQAVNNERR
jgi:integrase